MKEKRKNLDKIDLQAISRSSAEAGQAAHQQKIVGYADKVRKKLAGGKFKTDAEGFLYVHIFSLGYWPEFTDQAEVITELRRDCSSVEHEYSSFGSTWKIKP